ncbi:MAG TPA: flagellar biosynthesis protein FlhB, partial [Gammaproteobacteria bacterium]|nr:flagellar biosynthesis protein FlhB [Gammaproteobacteria bacterium]
GTFLYLNFDTIIKIGEGSINAAIANSIETVLLGGLITSMALVLIAMVDVPYQQYEFIKKLRMTKQE